MDERDVYDTAGDLKGARDSRGEARDEGWSDVHIEPCRDGFAVVGVAPPTDTSPGDGKRCGVCWADGRERRPPPGTVHLHALSPGDRFRTHGGGLEGTVRRKAPGRVRVDGAPFDTFSPTTIVVPVDD